MPDATTTDVEDATRYVARAIEHYGHGATIRETADTVSRIVEYEQIVNGVIRVVRLTVSIVGEPV